MTLYMIGVGLSDKKDITVKGLEAVKSCDKVYLEYYTSILPGCSTEELEEYYGKEITLATRDLVESGEEIWTNAKEGNVAFLVIGDVFGATTHTDLYLRAKEALVDVEIINNASILNAIGNVGLELYKFGKTTSMVFFDGDWKPITPYKVLKENSEMGLHTLILLDIKVAEPSKESILKEKDETLPPRFMTVNEGVSQLLELENIHGEGIINENTMAIGCARIGNKDCLIKHGSLKELKEFDFGEPVHCLIIPGKLHFIEQDMLNLWN